MAQVNQLFSSVSFDDPEFTGNVDLANLSTLSIYNTNDKVTNYERFRAYWSSNTFYLSNQYGGSGQKRPLFLNVNTAGVYVTDNASVGGGIRVISNPQTANTSIFGVLGVLNGSNSVQDGLTVAPYIQQTGTATSNALKISPYIGSVGAGVNLLNLGTNSSADNSGTHTSLFVVKNDGKVGIGTTTPTSKLQVIGLPTYADNATALLGNLTVGALYIRTGHGLDIVV